MAGEIALTPFFLATSASAGEVDATEGNGGVEHADLAARVLERVRRRRWRPGSTTARCCSRTRRGRSRPSFLNRSPSCVLTGYFGSTLPLSAANMLVYGCCAPLRPVVVGAGHRHAGLLRVLGGQEHQRALRDDAERALGDGALHGGGDLARVRLVVDDQRRRACARSRRPRRSAGRCRALKPAGDVPFWDPPSPVRSVM